MLANNLLNIKTQLQAYALESNREPKSVQLLAVSKLQSAEAIAELYQRGQIDFGESYLQEASDKIARLPHCAIQWHFIGPIQSNKTRAIAEQFAWVHTLDRLKIAERLHVQRPSHLPPLNVCIQVNIDHEVSKSGVDEKQLLALAQAVVKLDRLRLRGLMCLPAPSNDFETQRHAFRRLQSLYLELKAHGLALDTLSMGMSDDMHAAIAEGATWVRIGTKLFGQRR